MWAAARGAAAATTTAETTAATTAATAEVLTPPGGGAIGERAAEGASGRDGAAGDWTPFWNRTELGWMSTEHLAAMDLMQKGNVVKSTSMVREIILLCK